MSENTDLEEALGEMEAFARESEPGGARGEEDAGVTLLLIKPREIDYYGETVSEGIVDIGHYDTPEEGMRTVADCYYAYRDLQLYAVAADLTGDPRWESLLGERRERDRREAQARVDRENRRKELASKRAALARWNRELSSLLDEKDSRVAKARSAISILERQIADWVEG